MKDIDFKDLRNLLTLKRFKLCDKKALDYAGKEDRLINFKRLGAALKLRPEQILAVYATKHYDAILSYVRCGSFDNRSEPIQSRIDDLQNYLDLLNAIIDEEKRNATLSK